MSIMLELKPEVESHFAAEAAAQNIPVKDYIESILETMASSSQYESLSPEQRDKELNEWLSSHDYIDAPPLSDEAISRDSIYGERQDNQL